VFLRIAPNLLIVLASCGRLGFDPGVKDDANSDSTLGPSRIFYASRPDFATPWTVEPTSGFDDVARARRSRPRR
jgi:hypothetical protein